MAEISLFWDGTVLGDCGPYSQDDVMDRFFRAITGCTGDKGVLFGWGGGLLASGTGSPVSIATGAAYVYGMFYESDEAESVSIPTPAAGYQRYDRVVVRRDWSAQTVRLARVAGTAFSGGIGSVPALTQAAGAVYEIPLALALIDDQGLITLTDQRDFAAYSTEWPANVIVAGMYAEGAVTAAKIPDMARWDCRGSGSVEPNSANPATWTAGVGFYDYWAFADAAFNRVWVYFQVPVEYSTGLSFYVWSAPHVNGAGAGVENCQWDYSIDYGADPGGGTTLTNAAGTTNVDQQLRVNTNIYRDLLVALPAVTGDIVAIRLSRDGAADSYNSAMRFLGLEMYYTADA